MLAMNLGDQPAWRYCANICSVVASWLNRYGHVVVFAVAGAVNVVALVGSQDGQGNADPGAAEGGSPTIGDSMKMG